MRLLDLGERRPGSGMIIVVSVFSASEQEGSRPSNPRVIPFVSSPGKTQEHCVRQAAFYLHRPSEALEI